MNCLFPCSRCKQSKCFFFTSLANECIQAVQARGALTTQTKTKIENYIIMKIRRNVNLPITLMPTIVIETFFATCESFIRHTSFIPNENNRTNRVSRFLKESFQAVTYSGSQVIRRARRDFLGALTRIAIASGDFHFNSVPWIITVDGVRWVYKPRSLDIDAMVVQVFGNINAVLPQQHQLNTHQIRCRRDNTGPYGYAEFVDGSLYENTGSSLTGLLTGFFERLIDIIDTYDIQQDNIQSQTLAINYLLVDKIGTEFGMSFDWYHENIIFHEGSLIATPIDMEVVDLTRGPPFVFNHLRNQIGEYALVKADYDNGRADPRRELLLEKVSFIRTYADAIYTQANLNQIRDQFFETIRAQQPTIRCVPVATMEFNNIIYEFPPEERGRNIQETVLVHLQRAGYNVNGTVWNQNFVENEIFQHRITINIPVFQKRFRMEGQRRIEEILCNNQVIAIR